ncbi:UPF0764 protein C16orf89 [Plecturocebus cupreus]
MQWHDHSSLQPQHPGLKRSSCLNLLRAGTTGMGFHHVSEAGLKLLASSSPPTLGSQSAGITSARNLESSLFFKGFSGSTLELLALSLKEQSECKQGLGHAPLFGTRHEEVVERTLEFLSSSQQYEGSNFFISLTTLILCLFDHRCPSGWEVVSCDLNLHFPND